MCTVTYLPLSDHNFILTSNRDVPFNREKASAPQTYIEDGVQLTYPKDGKAGGTWIGFSDKKRLICLLNGGFDYHTSRSYYRKSRGLIVIELLKVDDLENALKQIDLKDIEPFTLVLVNWQKELQLYEFVWDGAKKHLKFLPETLHIWSSATLYDASVRQLRQDWFEEWLKHNDFTKDAILKFHHSAGIGDCTIDLMMNRGLSGTVSITSIKKINNSLYIDYEDVLDDEKTYLAL